MNDDYTNRVHEKVESDFLKTHDDQSIYIPDIDFFKPDLKAIFATKKKHIQAVSIFRRSLIYHNCLIVF